MHVEFEERLDHVHVVLNSDFFGEDVTRELNETVMNLINTGARDIRLDFSRTEYTDSDGISKLLCLTRKLRKLNGNMSITAISERLHKTLSTLAIDTVIGFPNQGGNCSNAI